MLLLFRTIALVIWLLPTSSSQPAIETTCFFSNAQESSLERTNRQGSMKVSKGCSGELTKMEDLMVKSPARDHFGGFDLLDLIVARGAGIYRARPESLTDLPPNLYFCEHHINELGKDWNRMDQHHVRLIRVDGKYYPSCSWPSNPPHNERIDKRRAFYLNREEARLFLVQSGIHLHIGLPLCKEHYSAILSAIEQLKEEEGDRTFSLTSVHAEEEEEMCQAETTLESTFFAFCKEAGIKRVCPKKNFMELAKDSKTRKFRVWEKFCEAGAEILVPDGSKDFLRSAGWKSRPSWDHLGDEKTAQFLTELSRQFMLADEIHTRYALLSIAARSFSLSDLLPFFPALTPFKYAKAHRITMSEELPEKTTRILERYDLEKIEWFVHFITSTHQIIGLPYGMHTVRLSNGQTIDIPNVIRNFRNSEIIRQFKAYMAEKGLSHLVMSDSTMIRILNALPATTKHNLNCVDSFKAAGYRAFEFIKQLLDRLQDLGFMTKDEADEMWFRFLEIRLYVQHDYPLHVKPDSRVPDHSLVFALSDPNNMNFAAIPSHTHHWQCPRCNHMEKTFREMSEFISSLVPTSPAVEKELKEIAFNFQNHRESITELKAHELRSVVTQLESERIVGNLGEDEVFMICDYAQKHLPKKNIEEQKDYYGKAGFSWHICHAVAKVSGRMVEHSFIHMIEGDKQDSRSTVTIIADIVKKLNFMGITGVHIRSDNAPNYHNSATLGSIPSFSRHGTNVLSWSFSEAQNGKGQADRIAAESKSKLRRLIDAGASVESQEDMLNLLNKEPLLPGVSFYLGNISDPLIEPTPSVITRVTDYSHFQLEFNYLRVWKYKGIGPGEVFKNLHSNEGIFEETLRGGMFESRESAEFDQHSIKHNHKALFWHYHPENTGPKEPIHHADDGGHHSDHHSTDSDNKKGNLFVCWCGAEFLRHGNYINHLNFGKHHIHPWKSTSIDVALHFYKRDLESMPLKSLAPLQNVIEKINDPSIPAQTMGWALRGAKKNARYPEKTKKMIQAFVLEKKRLGKRADPEEAFKRMKADVTIELEERMSKEQIKRYIRRLVVVPVKKTVVLRGRRASDVEMEDLTMDWKVEEIEVGEWEEITECELEGMENADAGWEQEETDNIYRRFIHKNRNQFFSS